MWSALVAAKATASDAVKPGGAKGSLGDAKGSLGDAKGSLGDAKGSLGDAAAAAAARCAAAEEAGHGPLARTLAAAGNTWFSSPVRAPWTRWG
jgi:hypothetical protein